MNQRPTPPFKPNVFALPNQTTIIFGLIVAVILGSVALGSIGTAPIPVWTLAVALFLLPLREFIAAPGRELSQYSSVEEPSCSRNDYTPLTECIEKFSIELNLRQVPKLLIVEKNKPGGLFAVWQHLKRFMHWDGVTSGNGTNTKKPDRILTSGSFRYWYIFMDKSLADELCPIRQNSDNPPDARRMESLIVHELYHFKTGDYWQLRYAGQLSRYAVRLGAWSFTFFIGMVVLLFLAKSYVAQLNIDQLLAPATSTIPGIQPLLPLLFPRPDALAEMRDRLDTVNFGLVLNFIASVTVPYILIGVITSQVLLPILWRVRELYADAGVVHTLRSVQALRWALTFDRPPTFIRQTILLRLRRVSFWRAIEPKFKDLGANHPNGNFRLAVADQPAFIFGTGLDVAILLGGCALLLDVFLAGNPLSLWYIGQAPMHFPTLTVFVGIALAMVPRLLQGKGYLRTGLQILLVVTAIRVLWLLLTIAVLVILLFFMPDTLSMMLSAAVAATARFAGYSDSLGFDNLTSFVVQASLLALAQSGIIFIILVTSLYLFARLASQMMTWYSWPHVATRLMVAMYATIFLVAMFLAFAVLPLVSSALFHPNFKLHITTLMGGGVTLVIVVAGFIAYSYVDGRYARCCPNSDCNEKVPGSYSLGKCCQECGEILQPWLLADYR